MQKVLQNPKVLQNVWGGGGLGVRARLLRTGFFSFQVVTVYTVKFLSCLKWGWHLQESKASQEFDSQLLILSLSGPVRDTPPYRAIPFRDSSAEGVSAYRTRFALLS